jgi:uncharacterized membrane protein YeaQ/YmgE (transglycosylase-associated protein family)
MLFMFVAALFDRLMFGASILATVLFARPWLRVLVIGVAVGILGEALLTAAQQGEFGHWLIVGAITATVQSALVFLVAERTRRRYAVRLAMMRPRK